MPIVSNTVLTFTFQCRDLNRYERLETEIFVTIITVRSIHLKEFSVESFYANVFLFISTHTQGSLNGPIKSWILLLMVPALGFSELNNCISKQLFLFPIFPCPVSPCCSFVVVASMQLLVQLSLCNDRCCVGHWTANCPTLCLMHAAYSRWLQGRGTLAVCVPEWLLHNRILVSTYKYYGGWGKSACQGILFNDVFLVWLKVGLFSMLMLSNLQSFLDVHTQVWYRSISILCDIICIQVRTFCTFPLWPLPFHPGRHTEERSLSALITW